MLRSLFPVTLRRWPAEPTKPHGEAPGLPVPSLFGKGGAAVAPGPALPYARLCYQPVGKPPGGPHHLSPRPTGRHRASPQEVRQGGSACGACVLSQVSVSLSLFHTHTPLGSCPADHSAVGKGAATAPPPSPPPVRLSVLPDSRERPSSRLDANTFPIYARRKLTQTDFRKVCLSPGSGRSVRVAREVPSLA